MVDPSAKQYLESLTEEGRSRLLLEAVTDYAIYIISTEGLVSSWNPGAQRFKGYTADEIIGKNFAQFYRDEDRAVGLPQRALATAANTGRFEGEGWRVRKDGTQFWAHVVIDAIRATNGTLVGFAKITRDLTERKESQRNLEQTQQALFQSQKMESIGQLTGGIAHDFNNLLMAVLGSLELLRKRIPNDPKVLALLDNAVQGARRGASLTQRMLAFARKQELKPQAFDARQLVSGMTELIQRALGPSFQIENRFPRSLKAAMGDSNQVELALLNLAMNARDAMPDGGLIEVSAREARGDGDYIVLAVTDRGEGMDEETLSRAREPFFTTKGPGKGTGLGLSMVHGMAEQSGGRLQLESKKGVGTTAEIWLPVASGEAAKIPEVARAAGSAVVESLVILAVDDDSLVLVNTATMLEDLGHSVLTASSARQALEILERDRSIDLVITDQVMPAMTGAQLLEIVALERPGLPAIIATGFAELPHNIAVGQTRLSKPFDQAALAAALGEVMTRARTQKVVKLRAV